MVVELKSKSIFGTIATNQLQKYTNKLCTTYPDISFKKDFKIEKKIKKKQHTNKKTSAILTLIHMVILFSNIFSKLLKWVGSRERNVIRKTWFYIIPKLKITLIQHTFKFEERWSPLTSTLNSVNVPILRVAILALYALENNTEVHELTEYLVSYSTTI